MPTPMDTTAKTIPDATTRYPPPAAERHPRSDRRHGETVADDYAWLKDPNWREVMRDPDALDPGIRAYLDAENAYTEAILGPTRRLQDELSSELKARIKGDDSSVPERDGPYLYYQRFEAGDQHPIYCRRRMDDGAPEEIVLDSRREAEGMAYYRIASCRHSPDHRFVAYTEDCTGSELYTLYVKELATGEVLADSVAAVQGDFVWAGDSRTLFYIELDDSHRPSWVFRHRVGTDPADDVLVFEEPDSAFYVGLGRTESGRFVLIRAHDHAFTAEVRYIDALRPDTAPVLFAPRRTGLDYTVSDEGDRWLILTNANDAVDFKIAEAPLAAHGHNDWRDLVPHTEGRLIRAMRVFEKHLARLELTCGLPRIVIRDLASGGERVISFDEEAYDLSIVPGFEYDTRTLRFTYSSLATPMRTFDYDMASRERTLIKEQVIPSGFDAGAYVTRRLYATSHDGARVPISLVHAKSTPLDGSAPLFLYGYGAYGAAIPAAFSPMRFTLIDRGFVFAIAHVRGGMEMGFRWYLDGKLGSKRNTFLDFIAAAEHLIAAGFTATGNIVAMGRSAGGMLVGAVANMRPELFRAVVAEVPFVDVLRTMCDPDLPLTPPEWTEWGNPIEDPEAYRTIRSYSPFDNVRAQAYPHVLATAGIADPRVTYWEPAKWVARLRAYGTGDNLVLLSTNMQAGHAGEPGRLDRLEEVAMIYAFILFVCGKVDEERPLAA